MDKSGVKRLWATWRSKYVTSKDKDNCCVFCDKIKSSNDEETHLLYRGKNCFVALNIYPYNNGHIMIIPYRHIDDIVLLSNDESREMMNLLKYFTQILKKVMSPEGFNIGFNIGKAAGAGIADHIHLHLLPRWSGDTNFMTTIAEVRVIPEDLDSTYKKIKAEIKIEEISKC